MQVESISLRRATVEDAEAIAEIYNEAIPTRLFSYSHDLLTVEKAAAWIEKQDDHHPMLVISVDGMVAGWAKLSRFYGSAPWHMGLGEPSLCVTERFRGRGLGKRLINALLQEARKEGYWKLVGLIFSHNEPSRALFRTCGFREVGVWERHGNLDGRWIDVVIYERLIPENQPE